MSNRYCAYFIWAAEALEEKAKQMGITIKVETDGSSGTKNAPTAKEIEECEAIIVALIKMSKWHVLMESQ